MTCLTNSDLHNVFQSSMHALTIRYRNKLYLGVLFHNSTNFTFLCVVKIEQETDSLGLSGQNQDTQEKLTSHVRTNREAFNTWLFLLCIKSINTQVFVGLYMDQS